MNIALVYGTASRPGRLWIVLEAFSAALGQEVSSENVVNLHQTPVDWADGRPLTELSAASQHAVDVVSSADAVVLFSPVYRASMPGALKNFLDLVPVEALESKALGVVSMGATAHHYLAVDNEIRRIGSWFGAVALPTSLYLSGQSFENGELKAAALADVQSFADTTRAFTQQLENIVVRPRPLAAMSR
jgi:FMN reductase